MRARCGSLAVCLLGRALRDGAPPVIDILSKLGPSDAAGIPGRLMDRCCGHARF